MDDVINLITVTSDQDEAGVSRQSYAEREVFCKVSSVTRSEFFAAGRSGLNPEYVFSVFAGDYDGEELLSYRGLSYAIYRTYRKEGDYIELYAERKGGTNGKGNTQ